MKPLAIDLFCGVGGWTDGLLAAGFDCLGFDIERHEYAVPEVDYGESVKSPSGSWFIPPDGRKCEAKKNPDGRMWGDKPRTRIAKYPAQLVLQDVRTLHGSQFRDAALIVASPPCQEFSWMAMPWSRAKQVARALRGEGEFPDGYNGSRTIADLTALFDACFRIQREASAAAGHHIPLVVENVRGAQPWVGRSRWNYGSFHLWGDVPALMPMTKSRAGGWGGRMKTRDHEQWNVNRANFSGTLGWRDDGSGRSMQSESVDRHIKQGGDWFSPGCGGYSRHTSSKSSARKAASAMIARIPFELARHIAQVYYPREKAA